MKKKTLDPIHERKEAYKNTRKRQNEKKKSLVPRDFGSGTLTKAGKHAKIVSALRKGSRYWKPVSVVREQAFTKRKVNKSTGRLAKHYKCAECKDDFPASETQVDHMIPLVDPCGFTTWDSFIERLYCEEDNLQLLCKPCHQIKTNSEKAARSEWLRSEAEKIE